MGVDKQARQDYKRGTNDRKLSFFDRAVNDITGQHPNTKPYYDARKGKPLDADKKKGK